MTVRKAERLLNLIALLLETDRPLTAQEIRETVPGYSQGNWESFKRMFERDKDDLREMGIPLERSATDAWETEEGYRIPKERYYLPDLDLGEDEIAALWLAAGLLRLQDPAAARTALLKLGDLPDEAERSSLSWLTADLGLAVPGLAHAFDAVARRKRASFRYGSGDAPRERVLDPYGLVHRRGAWYVVGRDQESGEVRSFRLDRVRGDVRILEPGRPDPDFEVPAGFRPEAALEAPPFVTRERPLATARVRFDASTAWWVERTHPWLRLGWGEDGSAAASVQVGDPGGFASWVLWFGEGAEVEAPDDLRREVLRRLEEICG